MKVSIKIINKYAGVLIFVMTIIISAAFSKPAFADTGSSSKTIEVNTGIQRVYAFENNQLVYDFIASTGLPWWPTPKGTFYPWIKLESDRMTGGSAQYGTYYDLPNVPWVVYFYNEQISKGMGYAIHGTYWHNNFGNPMSHGCVI